jgi:sulfur carrier protein
MELTVNGEARSAEPETTVADLMQQMGFEPAARGVAVAVNGAVVPSPSWHKKQLFEGDTVEIIHAVQGG